MRFGKCRAEDLNDILRLKCHGMSQSGEEDDVIDGVKDGGR